MVDQKNTQAQEILNNLIDTQVSFWSNNIALDPNHKIQLLSISNKFVQNADKNLKGLGFNEDESRKLIGKTSKTIGDILESKGLNRGFASTISI